MTRQQTDARIVDYLRCYGAAYLTDLQKAFKADERVTAAHLRAALARLIGSGIVEWPEYYAHVNRTIYRLARSSTLDPRARCSR